MILLQIARSSDLPPIDPHHFCLSHPRVFLSFYPRVTQSPRHLLIFELVSSIPQSAFRTPHSEFEMSPQLSSRFRTNLHSSFTVIFNNMPHIKVRINRYYSHPLSEDSFLYS